MIIYEGLVSQWTGISLKFVVKYQQLFQTRWSFKQLLLGKLGLDNQTAEIKRRTSLAFG